MSIFRELKRRNVIKVAIAYAIVAWLIIEIAAMTFPMLRLPEWTATFVTVLLLIGFPVALIFAWAFEITPEGIKREKDVDRSQSITHITGRKLDYLIIAVLVLALGFFAFDKFVLGPSRQGKTVLVQYQGPADPDTGGAFTVKRYSSEKETDGDGSWRHTSIMLSPLNPDYSPIMLSAVDADSVQVVGEFLTVLHSAG